MSREFHYVLTLTWSVAPNSSRTFTADGMVTADPGATRHGLYHFLLGHLRKVKVIPDDAAITTNCFVLEPNDLDSLTSSPAVTAPAGEAAHPGPPRSGDERGPGCVPSFPC